MSAARRLLATLWLTASLSFAPVAFAQDARALEQQARAAYGTKDFGAAAKLFVAAAEAGMEKATNLYNAACSFALAGNADEAFRYLHASIDAGLDGSSPAIDPDFKSLHADPRWAALIARLEAKRPDMVALKTIQDGTLPQARRYAAGRRAIADGASVANTSSAFNSFYALQALFVGEYDEARRIYGGRPPVDDVIAAGYTRAVHAIPVVLAQARGRQAVFLNESHGQAQTRAANFTLLAGLRAEGFDVLALEALSTEKKASDPKRCSNVYLGDPELPVRGYAVSGSGYYTQDPVYAETIREALRLGFRLVAYDGSIDGGVPEREQNQAAHLACVFKDDPKARMVVIAGFAHIAEGKDYWVPGGAMAYRFKALTGIDPLTVDTTTQLHLDPAKLSFATNGSASVSYVLEDAQGKAYRTDNFDLVLFVPAPAHRDDGKSSWLSLGGARKFSPIDVPACRGLELCVLQARRKGEMAAAIASDACVIAPPATGCNLFLRPGSYEVVASGADAAEVARVPLLVGAASPD